MNTKRFHLARIAGCAMGLMVLASGCATPNKVLREPPEVVAAKAVGAADAIVFDVTGGATDAPDDVGETLSLEQAVRLTLQTDSRIQSALARVRMAQADSDQVRLLPNPILSVVLKFPEGGGRVNIEAGVAADLISILRQRGRISVADNRLRASAAEAVTVTLDAAAEVQERYLSIQMLEAQLEVLQDRRAISDRLTSLARARLEAGEGTQLDLITLQTRQVELEAEIADQLLALREERLSLAKLIGQPSGDADWRVERWSPVDHAEISESEWIAQALANRPEAQAARWALEALGDELSQAGFSPFDGGEVGVEAERDDDWSVGPGVSTPVPIFDMGQAKKARARAAVVEARHQLTETQRRIVEETRRAHAALDASNANLARVRDELIPLQEKRLSQAEAQYQAGQTDITDLLLAEQDLRAARAKRIELERTHSLSLVRLERAAGGAVQTSNHAEEKP